MSLKSEVQNYATYLGNAWDKAEEKGATIPANKNLNNLATAIDGISTGGGAPTNSTTVSVKAKTSSIDANTFVQLEESVFEGNTTQLTDTNLNTNITLKDGDNFYTFYKDTNANYLTARVSYDNEGTITAGSSYTITTSFAFDTFTHFDVLSLGSGKFFVTYNGSSTDAYKPHGVIVQYDTDNNTWTKGTEEVLSSYNAEYGSLRAVYFANKICVFHGKNSSDRSLCVTKMTYSGTTISGNTTTALTTVKGSAYISGIIEEADKLTMICGYTTSASTTPNGSRVVQVDSSFTFTSGNETVLGNFRENCPVVDTTFYNDENSGVTMYTVNTSDLSFVSKTVQVYSYGTNDFIAAVKYGTRVALLHKDSLNGYSAIAILNDNEVEFNGELSYIYRHVGLISGSGKIYVFGALQASSTPFPYIMAEVTTVDKKAYESVNRIDGLTKDQLTTTTAGQVYILQ